MQTGRIIKMLAGMTLAIGIGLWAVSAQATTILQYNFQQNPNAGILTDISGNGHDGWFNSSAAPGGGAWGANGGIGTSADTPSGTGQSWNFPGAYTEGIIENLSSISFGGGTNAQFTLEMSVKPSALRAMTLFYMGETNGANYIQLSMDTSGIPYARLEISNAANIPGPDNGWQWVRLNGSNALSTDAWTQLAVVYNRNSDGYERFYVNGQEVANYNIGVPVYGMQPQDWGQITAWDYPFGTEGPGLNGQTYQGLMNDVRLSDVALSPDQFLGVPEPSSLLLLGVGGLLLWRRRGTAKS